jgi:hypothetical protein
MLKKNDSSLSRRAFLATAAGAGSAALLGPAWLKAADIVDPRMAQVKAKTIAIDMHNHIFSGAAGIGGPATNAAQPIVGPAPSLVDQLKLGGFTAVVAGYKIPFD